MVEVGVAVKVRREEGSELGFAGRVSSMFAL